MSVSSSVSYLPELKKVGLSPDKVVRARYCKDGFENGVQNDACPPACESVLPLFPAEARIRGMTRPLFDEIVKTLVSVKKERP